MFALGALLVGLSIGGLWGLYKDALGKQPEKQPEKEFIAVPSAPAERKFATIPGASRRNLK